MIITRTPVRVSLLGGGTDFPLSIERYGGLVLGGSINHYVYVAVRRLPPYHDFKTRVAYSKIETVKSNQVIEHPVVNACVRYSSMESDPLEISHFSDLPGRSGTGSSSSFTVGLLSALAAMKGQRYYPLPLARAATEIERVWLQEAVGCQDQIFAAYGGLNLIRFHQSGDVSVEPLVLDKTSLAELESHLLLLFTKIQRSSSEVTKSYVSTIAEDPKRQNAMLRLTRDGLAAIFKKEYERLGSLIDQSWRMKASLSAEVSNQVINDAYATARLRGAFGGKITGAGGGGMLLLVAPPEKQVAIKAALPDLVPVPFRFEFFGSQVIHASED